jgi:hypothetical protein
VATKKEVWLNNRGEMSNCEFDALVADLDCASNSVLARGGGPDSGGYLSTGIVAAIDALHEYAHRGEREIDALVDEYKEALIGIEASDSGVVLPEGVPPELDDWVKRWEWITARVTLEQVRELREGDQVRIGLNWYPVAKCGMHVVWVRTAGRGDDVGYAFDELAPIANEVRHNGR